MFKLNHGSLKLQNSCLLHLSFICVSFFFYCYLLLIYSCFVKYLLAFCCVLNFNWMSLLKFLYLKILHFTANIVVWCSIEQNIYNLIFEGIIIFILFICIHQSCSFSCAFLVSFIKLLIKPKNIQSPLATLWLEKNVLTK